MHELVLIGGGGHAVVVAEAAALIDPGRPVVVLDDADDPTACSGRIKRIGSLADLGLIESSPWILCLGDLALRQDILDKIAARGAQPASSIVHPAAFVSPTATLGVGVFVGPNAVVHSRAAVGDHAIINSAAVVEHDVAVGANAHIAPGVVLGGAASVGQSTLVGLGARILPGVVIGRGCVIGAGAVVTKPVADSARVAGIPARPV